MSSSATPFNTIDPDKQPQQFRNFSRAARAGVREFYRLNHTGQTLAFVRAKKAEYLPPRRTRMGIWDAFAALEAIVDDSDPDTDLPQTVHALQTAEALRQADAPRWLILTGLIHDLGKVLCLFGEPQWAVVGDTFPVGCAFSNQIVFPELFAANPDVQRPEYQTRCGIYSDGCGLDRVHVSWGHDEYLYQVVVHHLPEAAAYVIRYHSFYAAHRQHEYGWLMDQRDRDLFTWVRRFNAYDLYSKSAPRPEPAAVRPFYEKLADEFLPRVLQW